MCTNVSLRTLALTKQFNNVLELSEKHGFFKLATKNVDTLSVGPVGALLQDNLRSEWLYSTLTNSTTNNVFLNTTKDISLAFCHAKQLCRDDLPFGIVSVTNGCEACNRTTNNYGVFFEDTDSIDLINDTFVSSTSSMQFFHQWQRLRRMWWRKFSASPGRYSITDVKSDENNNQFVDISADYAWGSFLVESIVLKHFCDVSLPPEEVQFRKGRKKLDVHTIRSSISLPGVVFNAVCDSYDEPLYKGQARPLLRLHRKLAPYKVAFTLPASKTDNDDEELSQLALYLCKQLKNNNVSTLHLPNNSSNQSLENQWKQFDQLGVPYCVILDATTLRNGIGFLRSRDTTLKEQIHITELPKYVDKLFKNY